MTAIKLEAKIMAPIGIAVSSPAIPTSGAVIAPKINGSSPSNADALPAICPCFSIASEKDDVAMTPIEATKKKIGRTIVISGPFINTAINSNVPDVIEMNKPDSKNRFSDTTPVRRPTTWVPIISPNPFIPNNMLNVCGETPYIF